MNIEEYRAFCLAKPEVTEGFPFDNKTLVFKVMGKIFALTDIDSFEGINLKCDPDYAIELREHYQAVSAGYHMNKKHWNTVQTQSDIPDEKIMELINHSYELVARKNRPKKNYNKG